MVGQKCRGKKKCYQTKDKKKCSTPNAWVIFLRSIKGDGLSLKDASKYYNFVFKPQLTRKMIAIAGADATLAKQKAAMHKLICRQFYKNLKIERKNKKISKGVASILKKNSISQTLAQAGAKKAAAALLKKEKDKKKAAADVAAKEKAVKEAKRKAASVIKRALQANMRAKKLAREASEAAKKVVGAKRGRSSSGSGSTGAKKARASSRGVKRIQAFDYNTRAQKKARASSRGVKRIQAFDYNTRAQKKARAASDAQKKADKLKTSVTNANKKVKVAGKAHAKAKKTKQLVTKRKLPRAVTALNSTLKGQTVTGKRRR